MSNEKKEPVKPPPIRDEQIDPDLAEITMTVEDLTYNGFNAAEVRRNIHVTLNSKEINTLVAAYCLIGNNISRATGKVRRPRADIGLILKKSGTTLARVGLAFPALVRAIRANFPRNIGKRISDCKTPAEFQDPACAPYHPDGRDFHEKFSRLVYNPAKAKVGVDYFTIAVANRDKMSEELMQSNLKEIIDLIRTEKY
jgi:hypothetical protein